MSSDFMLDITFYESKPTRFSSFSRNIGRKSKEKVVIHTLQKYKRFMFDVIDPAKRFIFYIHIYMKTQSCFFHFVLFFSWSYTRIFSREKSIIRVRNNIWKEQLLCFCIYEI